jgi:hypothetical protein
MCQDGKGRVLADKTLIETVTAKGTRRATKSPSSRVYGFPQREALEAERFE